MNKHVAPSAFANAAPLADVLAADNASTFFRLAIIQQLARSIDVGIIGYKNIPRYPECDDYRERALERIKADFAEMQKALADV